MCGTFSGLGLVVQQSLRQVYTCRMPLWVLGTIIPYGFVLVPLGGLLAAGTARCMVWYLKMLACCTPPATRTCNRATKSISLSGSTPEIEIPHPVLTSTATERIHIRAC